MAKLTMNDIDPDYMEYVVKPARRRCNPSDLCDDCNKNAEYDTKYGIFCEEHFLEEISQDPGPSDGYLRHAERKQMGISG